MKRYLVCWGVLGVVGSLVAATVVSKVQCRVKDPRTLRDAMGFREGQSVSVVTLDDSTSDLDRNGDYCVTSFPAVLAFKGDAFKLNRVNASPMTSSMDMQMGGHLGDPSSALLQISLSDPAQGFMGEAELEGCYRVH